MYAGSTVNVVTRVVNVSGHSDVLLLSQCGPTGRVVLAVIHSLGVIEI